MAQTLTVALRVRTAKQRVRSILAGALGALFLITGPLHGAMDEGRVKAGLQAYEHHEYPKAIELLAPLIQAVADPREMAAIAALGFSYYFTESYEKALPYLEQAALMDKDNIELNYAFGLAALRLRRTDEGRSAFARIFRVSPASAKSHVLVAKIMMSEQMEDLAEGELEAAEVMDPAIPQLHYLRGELAIFHGDLDKGIELLRKELLVDPANSFAYYRLGDVLSREGLWDQAAGVLRQSIWLNPDFSSPYILLAKVYFKKDRRVEAEQILKRGLAMDPNNASGHYLLGTIYRESGRTALAQEEFAVVGKLKK